MQKKEFSMEMGGKTLTAEFNDMVDQANGSVILKYGDTAVLATAVMSPETRDGLDFFPLTVDYEEKFYAAGEILGSRFMRREGRPSEEAILSGRIIDRTIRPLFDSHIRNDTQIVITVLALGEDDPDVLAIIATSLALATSNIPWNGPVSAVRIGKDEAGYIINPTYEQRSGATMELTVSGKDKKVSMVEAGANQLSEDEIMEALENAIVEIEKIQDFQKKIIKEIGKEKTVIEKVDISNNGQKLFDENIATKLESTVFSGAGSGNIYALKKEWVELFKEKYPEEASSLADDLYEEEVNKLLHKEAVGNNRRADGRKMEEVRELYAQAGGISKVLHGLGIFYRGGTHILSALTLGGPRDSLIVNDMEIQSEKHFMHHYNFPPFSSGETGRMGGTNRRMIGHGVLAERALSYVIPPKEKFPYTLILAAKVATNTLLI